MKTLNKKQITDKIIDLDLCDSLLGRDWASIQEIILSKFSHKWNIETAIETYDANASRIYIRINTAAFDRICELRFSRDKRLVAYSISNKKSR